MDGRMWVESDGRGQGSAFYWTIYCRCVLVLVLVLVLVCVLVLVLVLVRVLVCVLVQLPVQVLMLVQLLVHSRAVASGLMLLCWWRCRAKRLTNGSLQPCTAQAGTWCTSHKRAPGAPATSGHLVHQPQSQSYSNHVCMHFRRAGHAHLAAASCPQGAAHVSASPQEAPQRAAAAATPRGPHLRASAPPAAASAALLAAPQPLAWLLHGLTACAAVADGR
jgi:hypothetical protein